MEHYWSCTGMGVNDKCVPEDSRDPRILPKLLTLPPFRAIWNYHVAVGIFFQLSGFVLPLNYLKKCR
jgi:peptidoglycan/LPS O-acetylase OafA/YrhL